MQVWYDDKNLEWVVRLSFSLLVLLEEAWLELNETNARQTRLWPTWDYEQFMPGTWGTFQHNNIMGEMNIAFVYCWCLLENECHLQMTSSLFNIHAEITTGD